MEMTKEQLELITNQLATIKERSPFYAKKFEGIDVDGRAHPGRLRKAALLRER